MAEDRAIKPKYFKRHLRTEGLKGIYEIVNVCNVCGAEYISASYQSSLYCNECGKEIKREKARERKRRQRARDKEKENWEGFI